MKYRLSILLLLLAVHPASSRSLATFACAGATIVLLDSSEAAVLSAREDTYFRELTPFDLRIRLGKPAAEVTQAEYVQAAVRNVRSWSGSEQRQLRRQFARIDSFVRATGLDLHLPDTIRIVKTTAAEEFGAEGYTRENLIMLNTDGMGLTTHLLAHELWHVISRHNAALRDKAYAVFNFKACNNIIYKPALNNEVVTNPDCPFLSHYVTLEKDGQLQDMALIFYLKTRYRTTNPDRADLGIGLLALEGGDAHKAPMIREGKPVIYELGQVPDLMKKIGNNTMYMLHIEEVAAEHFAALVTGSQVPEMDYVSRIGQLLKN